MPAIRVALLVALLPVLLLRMQAQNLPAPGQGSVHPDEAVQGFGTDVPTIHVISRIVVLDVVVTDGHGHSIKGLKPSDFTLTEDGVPQSLASFAEHDTAAEAPPIATTPEPLPPNTFTVKPPISPDQARTVIVLGALSFVNAPQVRYEIQKYMKAVPAGIPIAIFRGDWKGVHLIQDFTTDPKVLQEAVSSQRILPPLGFVPASKMRPPDARGLAHYLSSIPGRINLIWISDGGAPMGEIASSFHDVSDFLHDLKGATNVLRLSRIAVYPIDANGVTVPFADQANFDGSGVLPSMGGSVFGQDPALLFADVDLGDMAAATGGKLFWNTNGYKQAIAEVVETGSHYYTISYSPTNPNWNGALRRIKIAVPDQSQNETMSERIEDLVEAPVRVEYRNSYRALATPDVPPDASGSAQQRKLISYSPKGGPPSGPIAPIQAAMGLGASAPDAIHFKVTVTPAAAIEHPKPGAPLPKGNFLVAPWRDQPYSNVQIHYSINPDDLQFDDVAGRHHDTLAFDAVLFRDDGVVVNSFSGKVPITVDDQGYSRIMSAPLALDRTIAIPLESNYAHYILRTAVHEISTDRIGAIEIPAEWIKLAPAQTIAAAPKQAP